MCLSWSVTSAALSWDTGNQGQASPSLPSPLPAVLASRWLVVAGWSASVLMRHSFPNRVTFSDKTLT